MAKLIVGLGNPGTKYENTRHNVGFMAIDKIVKSNFLSYKSDSKFDGEFAVENKQVNGRIEKIYYAKPHTFMNLSGNFVKKISDYFDIDSDNIVILYDDINFEPGKIRIREKGSHGGQNGMRNIIDQMKTSDIKRIKIGVGKNGSKELSDHVLSNFSKSDLVELDVVFSNIERAINEYIETDDFHKVMSKYN